MQTHDEILNALKAQTLSKERSIPMFKRWYTIDNILYVFYGTITDEQKAIIKSMFTECDYFGTYGNFSIDMNKQPYLDGRKPVKTYTRKEVAEMKRAARMEDNLFTL